MVEWEGIKDMSNETINAIKSFKNTDKLNREKYADFLIEIIKNSKNIKRPTDSESFVLGIDSSWGTGKTTFLDMLENKISTECINEYIIIKYDAWKSDLWESPFETLAYTIFDNSIFNYTDDKHNIKKMAKKVASGMLKKTAPIFLPPEVINLFENIKIEDIKAFWDNNSIYNDFFDEYRQYSSNIENMKTEIKKILDNKKLIIFIDELDRCKPDFAIKLLEIIKHLFDIPNVIFIFALDMTQLSCSVESVYGKGIDATGYLCRFFDYITKLPQFDVSTYIDCIILEKPLLNKNIYYTLEKEENKIYFNSIFKEFSKLFDLSLRDINTIYYNFLLFEKIELSNIIDLKVYEIYLFFMILKYKRLEKFTQILLYKNTEIFKETISLINKLKKVNNYAILENIAYIEKNKNNNLVDMPINAKAPENSQYIEEVINEREMTIYENIMYHSGDYRFPTRKIIKNVSINNNIGFFGNALTYKDILNWKDIKNLNILNCIHRKLEVFDFSLNYKEESNVENRK